MTSDKERVVFFRVKNAIEGFVTGSLVRTKLKIARYVYFYYFKIFYFVSYYLNNFSQLIFALLFKMESKLFATKMSF